MSFKVSVPGKVILHGEHSVVYGKAAVAVSLNLRTTIQVESSEDNAVHLELRDLQRNYRWSLEDFRPIKEYFASEEDQKVRLPKKELLELISTSLSLPKDSQDYGSLISFLFLYSGISSQGNSDLKAAKLSISSELPIGAGLGSSAAYSVSLAGTLLRLYGVIRPSSVPEKKDLDLISSWAYQSEVILHGKPSGIDNSVCTYGGALLFQNGRIQEICTEMPKYSVFLVNTCVPRNTKSLVLKAKDLVQRHPKALNNIFNSMEEIALESWSNIKEGLLEDGKSLEKTSELIRMNHHLLCALGVSHSRLDEIVSLSNAHGFSAKLTGAGGGGCAFTLLHVSKDDSVSPSAEKDKLKEELTTRGLRIWEVTLGGTGIQFHD